MLFLWYPPGNAPPIFFSGIAHLLLCFCSFMSYIPESLGFPISTFLSVNLYFQVIICTSTLRKYIYNYCNLITVWATELFLINSPFSFNPQCPKNQNLVWSLFVCQVTPLPRCQYTSSKSAFFQKYCFIFSFVFSRPPVENLYLHSPSLLEEMDNRPTGYYKVK